MPISLECGPWGCLTCTFHDTQLLGLASHESASPKPVRRSDSARAVAVAFDTYDSLDFRVS